MSSVMFFSTSGDICKNKLHHNPQ